MGILRKRDRDLDVYRDAERALFAHHGLAPRQRWVEVGAHGTKVRALEVGEGRPVIFVHGMPTAGGVFAPLIAALAGVRAIVVDRPGCGLSDPLNIEHMTPARLRELNDAWLSDVVDQVGGGQVDVVGSSAGGMAAVAFATRHPDSVRTLTLDGAPAVDGMRLPAAMRAATVAFVARITTRRRVRGSDLNRSMRRMGHGNVFDDGRLSRADLEWRVALANHTPTMANEFALLRTVASWRGLRPGWAPGREEIAQLTMPSLWVAGDRDPFASVSRMRAWARYAPRSTVRHLSGSGHQPWLDDAHGHARMLKEFWAT